MKLIINHFIFILTFSLNIYSQAPDKMSYQAVIRDNTNNLITSSNISMRISILQGNINNVPVYVETQNVLTNNNGLVSVEIGTGTVISGAFFSIDWANGPYFLKTETDIAGGTNYSIIGVNQFLSVPYALYASNSGNNINLRSGSVILPATNSSVFVDVVFSSPLSNSNYSVSITKGLNCSGTNYQETYITNKTINGFRIHNEAVSNSQCPSGLPIDWIVVPFN